MTLALAAVGTLFVFVAAVGVVRLPDVLMRMHASSKASTLGVISILAAVAVRFGDLAVTARVVLTCAFLLATAPVAAHAIARAAWRRGITLRDRTVTRPGIFIDAAGPPPADPQGDEEPRSG